MRVVVVTGGTQVDWDDMRTLTNKSKGGFGCAIANAYFELGYDVTVIHAESVPVSTKLERDIFDRRSFRTYDDLYEMLHGLKDDPFDIIVMVAAVSDYAFDKVDGKVSSDEETITVTLRRTPKILSKMREWYADFRPFIIGFKLLSEVEPERLREVAMNQIKNCRINLTVANDWSELGRLPGEHPCYFVTPEGGFIRYQGDKQKVARDLAEFSTRRVDVEWSKSVRNDKLTLEPEAIEDRKAANSLLAFAQVFGLLYSTDGNVTYRISGTDNFWATPRQVAKDRVREEDFIYVVPDIDSSVNYYSGDVKPSIDCSVHARLYELLPDLSGILHFHGGYVFPDSVTLFPYPCGTVQEFYEILSTLNTLRDDQDRNLDNLMIELVNHGYLMLLGHDAMDDLWGQAENLLEAFGNHWRAVGEEERLERANLSPIFVGTNLAGAVAEADGLYSVFMLEEFRGKGYGQVIGRSLAYKGVKIGVHDDCQAVDFYKRLGYVEESRDGKITILSK